MPSRPIRVVTNGKISFFLLSEQYSILCIYHIFFINSSVDGHLDFCHLFAIVTNAAMNKGMKISLQYLIFISFGYKSHIYMGLLDRMVVLF